MWYEENRMKIEFPLSCCLCALFDLPWIHASLGITFGGSDCSWSGIYPVVGSVRLPWRRYTPHHCVGALIVKVLRTSKVNCSQHSCPIILWTVYFHSPQSNRVSFTSQLKKTNTKRNWCLVLKDRLGFSGFQFPWRFVWPCCWVACGRACVRGVLRAAGEAIDLCVVQARVARMGAALACLCARFDRSTSSIKLFALPWPQN